MGPKRIAALRRLLDEYRVGLARVNDADMIRLVEELLDENDRLRDAILRQRLFGQDARAAVDPAFEDVF